MAMRLYVHREAQQDAEALEADGAGTVGEAFGIPNQAAIVLAEDSDEPLSPEASLAGSLEDRAHAFAGQRTRVLATVTFNGVTIDKEFSASTRVRRVFDWAVGKHGFNLGEIDAAEHALALSGTEVMPPEDVHLGSLDADTPGVVAFDLVPKERFEG
jgi:hypothetical protein